jgi:hypothetical protein
MTDAPDPVLADPVAVCADVGGQGQAVALAAYRRWQCDIDLIDLDPRGQFPARPSAWIAPYRAWLVANGVDAARIQIISTAEGLRPVDLIVNLNGFGDIHKIKHLKPVLDRSLQPQTRILMDVRAGSGSFPFLKPYGSNLALSVTDRAGVTVTRILFHAAAATSTAAPAPWAAIARGLAGETGFYRESPDHSFLYIPRGDTLVLTFDNLDIAMEKREDRRPWGFAFIEKQGFSMLGVMANGWTWYRDPWVWAQFDDLRDTGFFAQFKRVVFYGASMGAYAACAFVPACPGADVVAISPQSTLDKRLVPWETRYHTAWGRDYSGPYGDAAEVSRAARRVTLLYDPYEPLDAAHVARFDGPNVMKLRTPLLGHRLGSSLQQMGILSQITLGALNGTLTELEFYRTIRARKSFQRYQRELFKRALAKGRTGLARKLGRWVLTRGDNRYIRKEMLDL